MVCEVSVDGGRAGRGGEAHRLGWKAMPFALDDLDSNCKAVSTGVGEANATRNVPW